MNLNVTIDFDEKWLCDYLNEDGEATISDAIKKDIIREIETTVYDKLMKKYELKFKDAVCDYIEKRVEKIIDDFVNSDEPLNVHTDRYSDKTKIMTCKEYIKYILEDTFKRESYLISCIESQASDIAEELKSEYDKKFASKIVENMKKLDLLKDDKIAELLK